VANLFNFGAWTGLGYRVPAGVWLKGGTVAFSQWRPDHLALRRPGLSSSAVTPPMLTQILAAPEGSFPRSDTMELRLGGSTVPQWQIEQAKLRITPRVFNGLAATETHHIAMTLQNAPDDHRWHRLEPTTVVELVDEFDRPTPIGQTGRLRVSTEDAPTAYLLDEEATRAFFKNGFFYPGDLARMREDGRIALQGRATDVINVKGNKIWPAPIEERVREALSVSGVCLLSAPNRAGDEELHLVIEAPTPLDPGIVAAVLPSELRKAGLGTVHITHTPALPRNAMGKVVRDSLTAAVIAARQG
jgi:acyl-CoA synthetase (AMP-forming)/AMP-acid ligase II